MPTFKGTHFRALSADNPISPGETEAIEKAVGISFPRIRRMMDSCVCDHSSTDHRHKLDSGDLDPDNTACVKCDCPEYESDTPVAVMNAMSWIAIRRAIPTFKLSDFQNCSVDDIQPDADGESPDPTEPTPTSPDIGVSQG
jgi:heterodisulfide reductase subunit B